jgi:AraC family transcriptional regulator
LLALSRNRFRAVDELIAMNIDQPPRLEDLARAIALSSVHFSRVFKKTPGRTPHQYLLEARVENAKRLLVGGR